MDSVPFAVNKLRVKEGMLKLSNIEVIYDKIILVLKGVSMEIPEGSIVALLGANGAGKSTTLKAISGVLGVEEGEISNGMIEFQGMRIDKKNAAEVVRLGIIQVMEGRRIFRHLTAEENLIAGAHTRKDRKKISSTLNMVYDYFPLLRERRLVKAGYLSGGEQQMLAIGRGLMAKPHLMLLDEPSLGLAPLLVEEIFGIVQRLNKMEKETVLLVEQNVAMALTIAHYGYIMENGRIVLDGSTESLLNNADVKEFYLGLTELNQRKSYKDVKHYRRRKRWLS